MVEPEAKNPTRSLMKLSCSTSVPLNSFRFTLASVGPLVLQWSRCTIYGCEYICNLSVRVRSTVY